MSSSTGINTQENDKQGVDENFVKILLVLAFVVVSPVTVITALAVYLMFSYGKIRRSVIAIFSIPIFLGVLIFIKPAVNTFVASWTETFPTIVDKSNPVVVGIFTMLVQQLWIAVPIGILVGLGFATWRWFTRARWKEIEFRRTPWEVMRYNRTVKKIKNDEDTPLDGMTLGVRVRDGVRIVQTTQEAAAHTFIVGGSNSGKTRTAMMRIRDQIKRGEAVVIVDLKNDPELANYAKICAVRYGRGFKHFTLQDNTQPYEGPAEEGNAHYDPLAQGDPTRRANMVLDLRDWTNADYFKKMTEAYLQLMFTVLINNPRPEISTLEDAIDLMSPKYLQERARVLDGNQTFATLVRSVDALNDDGITGAMTENLKTNRSQFEIFLQGIAGPWLKLDKKGNNIKLLETAYNGDVVVFSLDSQAYGPLSANLANLIIQDLKTVSSELLRNPADKPFNVFIDEFSAIGSDNIVGLINKARASNMSVTLATQTLGDLVVKDPSLRMQIMGIISSFIIHRANTFEDAEVYSGLTGNTTVNKVRQSANYSQNLLGGIGTGVGTGNASVEEVEQWKVMPHEIQDLDQGEMFYINTSGHRVEKVKVIIDDIADPVKGGTADALDEVTHQNTEFEAENTSTSTPTLTKMPELVNQEFTSPTLSKESFVSAKSENNKKNAPAEGEYDPFAEARESKKVEINYGLLRSFFNSKKDIDIQQESDIADGVAIPTNATTPKPDFTPVPAENVSASSTPKSTTPAKPRFPGAAPAGSKPAVNPGAGFPNRPVKPTQVPPRPVKPAPTKSPYEF